jgi:hypothetical protein
MGDLLLVPAESFHALFQVARHQELQVVAVQADQLAQEVDGQHGLPLGLLLDDDLGQDGAGDILARLGVVHHRSAAGAHHLAQLVEGDVAAGRGKQSRRFAYFLTTAGWSASPSFGALSHRRSVCCAHAWREPEYNAADRNLLQCGKRRRAGGESSVRTPVEELRRHIRQRWLPAGSNVRRRRAIRLISASPSPRDVDRDGGVDLGMQADPHLMNAQRLERGSSWTGGARWSGRR